MGVRVVNDGIDVDSLQRRYGNGRLIQEIEASKANKSLPLYRTQVIWWGDDGFEDREITIDLSQEGDLVEFSVDPEIVNEQTPFNRKLMAYAVQKGIDVQLAPATMDTILSGLLEFQHNRENSTNYQNMRLVFRRLVAQGKVNSLSSYLSDDSIWEAVDFYLGKSFWNKFEFNRDSVVLDELSGFRIAKAFLTSKDTVHGVVPTLQVDILPAGSLHKMSASYFKVPAKSSKVRDFLEGSFLFLFLSFIVWLLTIFYLRIKARAIDTRPAFIVAFVMGFMVSILFVFEQVGTMDISIAIQERGLTNILFLLGLIGAFSAVGFFLLTSVSDSVTRQYWPEKLKTWDLVRRGMFNNKPVGWSIVRGISIGSILAGIYVVMLDLIPGSFLESNVYFDNYRYMVGSVARLILNLLISMIVVVPIFMILINQLRSRTNKLWVIPFFSALFFLLLPPLNIEIEPFGNGLIFNVIIGALLGIFYIYFDFLTLSLAFFTFLNLILTKQGWLVDGSPDMNVFVVFVIISILLLFTSFLFIVNGNERDEIPDYVPEYLEDLAKEQRVTQELEIARTVQTTFLPNTTPDVPGFDTAAICEPAQETGGDYYDIICIDDDKAAIAIGDVSGKGIQAAFYMTFAKGVIHSLCSIFPSPKTMLFRVNKLFNQNATRGTFISMIYGVLDPKDRSFTYIRAGHNPMLYKKANGEMEWLQPKGVAIGMTKGQLFNKVMEEDTITIDKGDVVVLYTDGITEAQNENEEFYDEKRLYKLLKREKTQSAEELRDLIIEDVRTFIGNARQYDDMTLVVIKG
jgi:hypothetical protein